MSGYYFGFIGHCTEGTSDKIWGIAICGSRNDEAHRHNHWDFFDESNVEAYAFWGKRGKSIKFKKHITGWDLETLVRKKIRSSGYVEVGADKIADIWPDFEEQFEKGFVWQTLMN